MAYLIDKTNCAYCGNCERWCPFGAIMQRDGYYDISADKCTECGLCLKNCPTETILPDDSTEHRKKFKRLSIITENCIGCSLCMRACPVGAISGIVRQPFTVDQAVCIQCGACLEKCRKDAFSVEY